MAAQKRYLHFCEMFLLRPFPVCQVTLCYFVAYLADQNIAQQSIKCHLSGVRHLHVSLGHPEPGIGQSMPTLQKALRGVRSIQSKRGRGSRTRLPITPELLHNIRRHWEKETTERANVIMLWAACTTCFFGFFRAGEITTPSDKGIDPNVHLSFADLAIDNQANPTTLRIRLKQSKTDPFRRGVDVFVGRTGDLLCPVTAMVAYLAQRGGGSGPLFHFSDGRVLTRERFVARVREALKVTETQVACYSGHSFRSGAATTAARAGLTEATIKLLGRWESCAYLLYVKTPRDQLASLSQLLAKAPRHAGTVS